MKYLVSWLLFVACVGGMMGHFWLGGRRVELKMDDLLADLRRETDKDEDRKP